MPFVANRKWTWGEIDLGVTLLDPLLFAMMFWRTDLTIPPERLDLPEQWRGRQVISREQRIMCEAGADYMLLRETLPELALRSAQKVALRTSRKIAKTLFLEARIFQIPLCKTVEGTVEGMIHAPGDNHMGPIINRAVKKKDSTPLFKLIWQNFDRDKGINSYKTGFIWHWRIEGLSGTGRNMVGLRAAYMMGDEADYACVPAYDERDQTALPGCWQYWGGVPRGVRGKFWQVCNTDEGADWLKLRFDMRANPIYHSPSEWDKQVRGNYYSQRVQTQVLGKDGEEAVSSFPVVPVNTAMPFVARQMGVTEWEINKGRLAEFLALPVNHIEDAEAWAIYGDYGYAPSPTQLGVAYFKKGVWYTLARIEIRALDTFPTAELIVQIDRGILPHRAAVIVLDGHGQGRGVISQLQNDPRWQDESYGDRVVDVGFAGHTALSGIKVHKKCKTRVRLEGGMGSMWYCDQCGTLIYDEAELAEASIQTKTFLTDELKEAFANGQRYLDDPLHSWPSGHAIILGNDSEGIEELSGTTEIQRGSGSVKYIPPKDVEHITDQYRCLMSATIRYNQMTALSQEPDFDTEFGWAGDAEESSWSAPWGAGSKERKEDVAESWF